MLKETDLRELLSFQAEQPVVSVYLNTDPTGGSADAYKLNLRSMLKTVDLPQDVAAIEEYIEHKFDWSGRSVAVFSCAPAGFLRAYSLAVPVRSRVRTNNGPHVKPLADLLDFYGGYGIVIVDKQGARLFYVHMGEIVAQEGVLGESVRRTKRGGASSVVGQRGGTAGQAHDDSEVASRNMREAVDTAVRFFANNNVRRVLLSGTDDNVALFRSLLPKSWQSLVVGAFPMSMTATKEEVLARALQVGQEAAIRHEAHLIEVVTTSAAKKRGGVIGLDGTLRALHDGRVQTLLVREGFRAPGEECRGCGYLTAQTAEACPFCGGAFNHIPDAVELAVRKTMQRGGEVEILHLFPKADDIGNIGAILRY